MGPMCVLSAVCSLSFGELEWLKICGHVLFDFLDMVTNNYMLPLIALGCCLYVGWFGPKKLMRDQLSNCLLYT